MRLDRITRRLYRRLGPRYLWVWPATQIPESIFVVCGIFAVLSSYYGPSFSDLMLMLGGAAVFTSIGVGSSMFAQRAGFSTLMEWRADPDPSREATVDAWETATNLTVRSFRANSMRVNAIAAIPSIAIITAGLGLPWYESFVLVLVAIPAAGYATILNYTTAEILMRPFIADIAARMPDEFEFKADGMPILKRLMISLPVFTALTALIVSALVTDEGGSGLLLIAGLGSIGVALALSGELTVILAQALTRPVSQLREALAKVNDGDYDVRVPVVSSDELGELSHDFNLMVAGLAEREQIRDAFGTYVDREVAGLLLSGQFPAEGVEVDVSIMFCDVPGFTSFAERSEAQDVVTALNELFAATVPIIDRHGGHVDKFLGDGLLAVFGAPEGYTDHADRAVAAGLEIVAANAAGEGGLELRVGVNSGKVVAGSIGGAGRLNFSVIGDTVNVAARVEAATRDTRDEMLVTRATHDAMERAIEFTSRGSIPLKGKAEPCEVLAPALATRISEPRGARGAADPARAR